MTPRRCSAPFALVLVLAQLACGHDRGSTSRTVAPTPSTVPSSTSLAPLADAIDPGEQRPLFDDVPPVVAAVLGPAAALDDGVLTAPLAAWDSLPIQASLAVRAAAILDLARVLALSPRCPVPRA